MKKKIAENKSLVNTFGIIFVKDLERDEERGREKEKKTQRRKETQIHRL